MIEGSCPGVLLGYSGITRMFPLPPTLHDKTTGQFRAQTPSRCFPATVSCATRLEGFDDARDVRARQVAPQPETL